MSANDVFHETGYYLRVLNENNITNNLKPKIFSSHWNVNESDTLLISHQDGRLQIIKNNESEVSSTDYHIFLEPYSIDMEYSYRQNRFQGGGKKLMMHWDKLLTIPGKPNELIFVLGISKSIFHTYIPFSHDPDAYTRGTSITELHQHKCRVLSVTISHNGRLMASGDDHGGLTLQVLSVPDNSHTLLESFENARKSNFLKLQEVIETQASNTSLSFSGLNAVDDPKEFKLSFDSITENNEPIFSLLFLPDIVTKRKKITRSSSQLNNSQSQQQDSMESSVNMNDLLANSTNHNISTKDGNEKESTIGDIDHYFLVTGSVDGCVRIWTVSMTLGSYYSAGLTLTPFMKLNTILTNILSLNVCSSYVDNPIPSPSYQDATQQMLSNSSTSSASTLSMSAASSHPNTTSTVTSSSDSSTAATSIAIQNLLQKRNKTSLLGEFENLPPVTDILYLAAGTTTGVVYMWKMTRLFLHTSIMNKYNDKMPILGDFRSDVTAGSTLTIPVAVAGMRSKEQMLCGLVQVSEKPIIQVTMTVSPVMIEDPPVTPHHETDSIITAPLILVATDAEGILHVFCEIDTTFSSSDLDEATSLSLATLEKDLLSSSSSSSSTNATADTKTKLHLSSYTAIDDNYDTNDLNFNSNLFLKHVSANAKKNLQKNLKNNSKVNGKDKPNGGSVIESNFQIILNESKKEKDETDRLKEKNKELIVYATAKNRDFIPCAQAQYSTPVISCSFQKSMTSFLSTHHGNNDVSMWRQPLSDIKPSQKSKDRTDPCLTLCTYNGDLGFYSSSSLFKLLKINSDDKSYYNSNSRIIPNTNATEITNQPTSANSVTSLNAVNNNELSSFQLPLTSTINALTKLSLKKEAAYSNSSSSVINTNDTKAQPLPSALNIRSAMKTNTLTTKGKADTKDPVSVTADDYEPPKPRTVPPPLPLPGSTSGNINQHSTSTPPVPPSTVTTVVLSDNMNKKTTTPAVTTTVTTVTNNVPTFVTSGVTQTPKTALKSTSLPLFNNTASNNLSNNATTNTVAKTATTTTTTTTTTIIGDKTNNDPSPAGPSFTSSTIKINKSDKIKTDGSNITTTTINNQSANNQSANKDKLRFKLPTSNSGNGHKTKDRSRSQNTSYFRSDAAATAVGNSESASTVTKMTVESTYGHPSINTSQLLSEKAQKLREKLEKDEISVSTVETTSTDRLRAAAQVVNTPVYANRYNKLTSVQQVDEDNLIPYRERMLRNITKQVDSEYLQRRQIAGPSLDDLRILEQPVDQPIELVRFVHSTSSSPSSASTSGRNECTLKTEIDPLTLSPIFVNEMNFENIFGSIEVDSNALWNDVLLKHQNERYKFLMSYL